MKEAKKLNFGKLEAVFHGPAVSVGKNVSILIQIGILKTGNFVL